MKAFLESIAEAVSKENLPYLYKCCYIFPTKRAAVYFTNFLKEKHQEENFILPVTITIQEFIHTYSAYIIKDDWYLLFTIYQIQNELTNSTQPFEKFLPWGKLILRDFDECDKYLVNASNLFSVLKAHKEVDTGFSISDETRKYIEQFIATTASKEKDTVFKDAFVKTWSLLGELYEKFQQELKQLNFAYEGMAYKDVLERLNSKAIRLPFSKISFCGFNALSVCEEKIFQTIEQQYDTEFWWDADIHFLNNHFHEAGNFLRLYQKKFSGTHHHWLIDDALKHHKQITITGISSDTAQIQYVRQHVEKHEPEHTAIVLCDETLLTPMLYAIDTKQVNISMGYSVTQSELYVLMESLLNFYSTARLTDKQTAFYHKTIEALCLHSYFRNWVNEKNKLSEILPYFVPYMPIDVLQMHFPAHMLAIRNDSQDIILKIIDIMQELSSSDSYFLPVRELLLKQLQRLLQLLKEKNIHLERNALPFIVKQFIGAAKLPFVKPKDNNEQTNYIQIMGFLETRILDFNNLFILSLNDDKLPGTNKTNSFIPYNLRKGFGLPTFEQFDGVNAYHFYRLLKRAKNIHLLYNNQIGDNASEKSRFISQIEHDLSTKDNSIKEYIASVDENSITQYIEELVKIKKTDVMVADLRQRKFSPSALKVYIKCPVQFYLKYIVDIKEPEEIEEDIDASVFGQILHKILELIYLPHLNTSLSKETIQSYSKSDYLQHKLKEACEILKLPKEILQGSNKLQLKIIERIAQKILLNDAAENELTILYVENKFIWQNLKLGDGSLACIQGTFDRVDRINENAVRILDYKTGHIELPKFPDINDEASIQSFLDELFIYKKKDFSAAFQGILYALMYYKLFNCREVHMGFHHAKKMKGGITYLNEQQPIPLELLKQFENRLSTLLSDIIYKNPYFIQTDNEKAYEYSVYKELLY